MYVIWLVCATKLQAHIPKLPLMGLLVYMGICEVVRLKTCFTLLRTRFVVQESHFFPHIKIFLYSYLYWVATKDMLMASLKRNQPITIGTYLNTNVGENIGLYIYILVCIN
jgi:hypothetical protein